MKTPTKQKQPKGTTKKKTVTAAARATKKKTSAVAAAKRNPPPSITLPQEILRVMSPADISAYLTESVKIFDSVKSSSYSEIENSKKPARLEYYAENGVNEHAPLSKKQKSELDNNKLAPIADAYRNAILATVPEYKKSIEGDFKKYLRLQLNLLKLQEDLSQEETFYPTAVTDVTTIRETKITDSENQLEYLTEDQISGVDAPGEKQKGIRVEEEKEDLIRNNSDLLAAYTLGIDYCYNTDEMPQGELEVRDNIAKALINKTELLLKLNYDERKAILEKERQLLSRSLESGTVISESWIIDEQAKIWFNKQQESYKKIRSLSTKPKSKNYSKIKKRSQTLEFGESSPATATAPPITQDEEAGNEADSYFDPNEEAHGRILSALAMSRTRGLEKGVQLRSNRELDKRLNEYEIDSKQYSVPSTRQLLELPENDVEAIFTREKEYVAEFYKRKKGIPEKYAVEEAKKWHDKSHELIQAVQNMPNPVPTEFIEQYGLTPAMSGSIARQRESDKLHAHLVKYGPINIKPEPVKQPLAPVTCSQTSTIKKDPSNLYKLKRVLKLLQAKMSFHSSTTGQVSSYFYPQKQDFKLQKPERVSGPQQTRMSLLTSISTALKLSTRTVVNPEEFKRKNKFNELYAWRVLLETRNLQSEPDKQLVENGILNQHKDISGGKVNVLLGDGFSIETNAKRIRDKYKADRLREWEYFFYYPEIAKLDGKNVSHQRNHLPWPRVFNKTEPFFNCEDWKELRRQAEENGKGPIPFVCEGVLGHSLTPSDLTTISAMFIHHNSDLSKLNQLNIENIDVLKLNRLNISFNDLLELDPSTIGAIEQLKLDKQLNTNCVQVSSKHSIKTPAEILQVDRLDRPILSGVFRAFYRNELSEQELVLLNKCIIDLLDLDDNDVPRSEVQNLTPIELLKISNSKIRASFNLRKNINHNTESYSDDLQRFEEIYKNPIFQPNFDPLEIRDNLQTTNGIAAKIREEIQTALRAEHQILARLFRVFYGSDLSQPKFEKLNTNLCQLLNLNSEDQSKLDTLKIRLIDLIKFNQLNISFNDLQKLNHLNIRYTDLLIIDPLNVSRNDQIKLDQLSLKYNFHKVTEISDMVLNEVLRAHLAANLNVAKPLSSPVSGDISKDEVDHIDGFLTDLLKIDKDDLFKLYQLEFSPIDLLDFDRLKISFTDLLKLNPLDLHPIDKLKLERLKNRAGSQAPAENVDKILEEISKIYRVSNPTFFNWLDAFNSNALSQHEVSHLNLHVANLLDLSDIALLKLNQLSINPVDLLNLHKQDLCFTDLLKIDPQKITPIDRLKLDRLKPQNSLLEHAEIVNKTLKAILNPNRVGSSALCKWFGSFYRGELSQTKLIENTARDVFEADEEIQIPILDTVWKRLGHISDTFYLRDKNPKPGFVYRNEFVCDLLKCFNITQYRKKIDDRIKVALEVDSDNFQKLQPELFEEYTYSADDKDIPNKLKSLFNVRTKANSTQPELEYDIVVNGDRLKLIYKFDQRLEDAQQTDEELEKTEINNDDIELAFIHRNRQTAKEAKQHENEKNIIEMATLSGLTPNALQSELKKSVKKHRMRVNYEWELIDARRNEFHLDLEILDLKLINLIKSEQERTDLSEWSRAALTGISHKIIDLKNQNDIKSLILSLDKRIQKSKHPDIKKREHADIKVFLLSFRNRLAQIKENDYAIKAQAAEDLTTLLKQCLAQRFWYLKNDKQFELVKELFVYKHTERLLSRYYHYTTRVEISKTLINAEYTNKSMTDRLAKLKTVIKASRKALNVVFNLLQEKKQSDTPEISLTDDEMFDKRNNGEIRHEIKNIDTTREDPEDSDSVYDNPDDTDDVPKADEFDGKENHEQSSVSIEIPSSKITDELVKKYIDLILKIEEKSTNDIDVSEITEFGRKELWVLKEFIAWTKYGKDSKAAVEQLTANLREKYLEDLVAHKKVLESEESENTPLSTATTKTWPSLKPSTKITTLEPQIAKTFETQINALFKDKPARHELHRMKITGTAHTAKRNETDTTDLATELIKKDKTDLATELIKIGATSELIYIIADQITAKKPKTSISEILDGIQSLMIPDDDNTVRTTDEAASTYLMELVIPKRTNYLEQLLNSETHKELKGLRDYLEQFGVPAEIMVDLKQQQTPIVSNALADIQKDLTQAGVYPKLARAFIRHTLTKAATKLNYLDSDEAKINLLTLSNTIGKIKDNGEITNTKDELNTIAMRVTKIVMEKRLIAGPEPFQGKPDYFSKTDFFDLKALNTPAMPVIIETPIPVPFSPRTSTTVVKLYTPKILKPDSSTGAADSNKEEEAAKRVKSRKTIRAAELDEKKKRRIEALNKEAGGTLPKIVPIKKPENADNDGDMTDIANRKPPLIGRPLKDIFGRTGEFISD